MPQLEIPDQLSERRLMIDRLLDYLSNRIFKGDDLAAQYLLASLAAKMLVIFSFLTTVQSLFNSLKLTRLLSATHALMDLPLGLYP